MARRPAETEPPTLLPLVTDEQCLPRADSVEIGDSIVRRATHTGIMVTAVALLAADAITKTEFSHIKNLGGDVAHHIGSIATEACRGLLKHLT